MYVHMHIYMYMYHCIYICMRMRICTDTCACICVTVLVLVFVGACMYMHVCIWIWQRIENIGLVASFGGHFATKVCNRRGCSATNPSAASPLKTTVLYTEVRDKGL